MLFTEYYGVLAAGSVLYVRVIDRGERVLPPPAGIVHTDTCVSLFSSRVFYASSRPPKCFAAAAETSNERKVLIFFFFFLLSRSDDEHRAAVSRVSARQIGRHGDRRVCRLPADFIAAMIVTHHCIVRPKRRLPSVLSGTSAARARTQRGRRTPNRCDRSDRVVTVSKTR